MTNKEKFKDTLDNLHKELCDVSDWMYHNPEVGFEEYETSKYFRFRTMPIAQDIITSILNTSIYFLACIYFLAFLGSGH